MSGHGAEFVRFIVPSRTDAGSQTAIGVIAFAHELIDASFISNELRNELRLRLTWFDDHMDVPERFNRTTSKGWYRRATRGISWLRSSAEEHVAAMQALAAVVSRCGYNVSEIRERRVGYLIYEDSVQVVAEPFRDTRTK